MGQGRIKCLIPPSCWMSWCSWWAPGKTSKYQWDTEIVTPPQHPEVIQNAGKFPVLSVCSLKLPFAITHRAIGNKSWFIKVKRGPDGMICKNIRRMKIFLPYKLCVSHVSGSSASTGQSPFLLFSSHFLFPPWQASSTVLLFQIGAESIGGESTV